MATTPPIPATGYCPACGRGDCAPTAEAYEQQRQRAEQATAELAQHEEAIGELNEKNIDLDRRSARAEAAVERVRALHYQDGEYCAVCTEDFGRLSVPWPCPTIRALGERP